MQRADQDNSKDECFGARPGLQACLLSGHPWWGQAGPPRGQAEPMSEPLAGLCPPPMPSSSGMEGGGPFPKKVGFWGGEAGARILGSSGCKPVQDPACVSHREHQHDQQAPEGAK